MECLGKRVIDTCVTYIYNGFDKLFFCVQKLHLCNIRLRQQVKSNRC